MKILCVGDVHIQISNIKQINEFLEKLEKFIIDRGIEYTILMGDILHTHERLHTVAFNTTTMFFKKLSQISKTYVLVGNHDYINNSQFLSCNHWMNCFKDSNNKNLIIVDCLHIEQWGDIKVTLCPYVPDGRFREALDTKKGEWEDSTYIFSHQLFDGAKMGAIVAENVEKWDKIFPTVISGHIHDKQTVQDNLVYVGSSMQHAFGESPDKTLLLINKQEFEYIDLQLPKKKIIYVDSDDLDCFDFGVYLQEERVEYKFVINGSVEDFNSFKKTTSYKELLKNNARIVFKQKRMESLQKSNEMKNNFLEKRGISFRDILRDLIKEESNSYLYKLMNDVGIYREEEDILFIEE